MFLYNILTGGSSKQQVQNDDKISFKINLSENIPQYKQFIQKKNGKPHYYQQQEQLTPKHPMFSRVFKQWNNGSDTRLSQEKVSLDGEKSQSNSFSPQKKENKQNMQDPSLKIAKNQVTAVSTHQKQNLRQGQLQSSQSSTKPYHEYITTQNDTLFGIALKLEIREGQIKQLNHISERLYPWMKIRLPLHCDISKLHEKAQKTSSKGRISELLGFQTINGVQTQKFQTEYYGGLAGYIKGTLSINKNYIIFNPDLQNQQNLEQFSIQKLLKFNAIVETIDIQGIEYMQSAQIGKFESKSQNPEHNHIIQIFLYIVGNSKIQNKYKQRLNKLKAEKKAIASIYFSLKGYKSEAKGKCQKIVQKVKDILKMLELQQLANQGIRYAVKAREQKRLTNIPFFDIIHENLHPKIKQQIQSRKVLPQNDSQTEQQQLSINQDTLACGILTEPSDIISDNMFNNLSLQLPMLYQHCNWTRIYSSTVNGTSFSTFLNRTKDYEPLIILVKQYKGWKFGAFLCESIQTGKTGRGEMFIFTFKDDKETPQVYKWTMKNEFFVFIQKNSGIGIGMGLKYGLFLRNTMDKGSSSSTLTFGNTQGLSKKEDFIIQDVQVWAVDNSY